MAPAPGRSVAEPPPRFSPRTSRSGAGSVGLSPRNASLRVEPTGASKCRSLRAGAVPFGGHLPARLAGRSSRGRDRSGQPVADRPHGWAEVNTQAPASVYSGQPLESTRPGFCRRVYQGRLVQSRRLWVNASQRVSATVAGIRDAATSTQLLGISRRRTSVKKVALCLLATTALASSACSVDVMGQTAILREQKRIPITSADTGSLTVRVFDGSLELRFLGPERDPPRHRAACRQRRRRQGHRRRHK